MQVKQISFVDIYRDGGSYGMGFEGEDGQDYELHLQSNRLRGKSQYETPVIYLGRRNQRQVVQELSWEEARQFLQGLSFDSPRFAELKKLLKNKGKAE